MISIRVMASLFMVRVSEYESISEKFTMSDNKTGYLHFRETNSGYLHFELRRSLLAATSTSEEEGMLGGSAYSYCT